MGIGKGISLVVFVLAALTLGVIAAGQHFGWWAVMDADPIIAGAIVLGAALFVATAFYLAVGARIDSEIAGLSRSVQGFERSESETLTHKSHGWLGPLTRAIEQALVSYRQRTEQLSSQRRELEIQCRIIDAERQHAEAILHSISDAVLVTDSFNEMAIANESAAETFRFELDDARHQPIDQIINDPSLLKLIRDTRDSGNLANRRHIEHTIACNGQPRTYNVTLSCVGNQQNEVAGVVTILHDVTKEKEISEMKSDFVSSVSHELRTPLSSIKAYVEMLVDGEARDEETRTEFYNIIQSESNRLSRLIDNILNISRIESGMVKIQRENISLPTVIKEVVDVMQPQARAKDITLTVQDTPLYYQVYADKDMIYQALLNLTGNAIKYTPQGGTVGMDTVVDDHSRTVRVNVSDSGVGIPADAIPHLFEKFYRVNDHKKIAKGTGLGLNLVKHIVETVHGGSVAVTSEVGKGSTFSISLPISDGPN